MQADNKTKVFRRVSSDQVHATDTGSYLIVEDTPAETPRVHFSPIVGSVLSAITSLLLWNRIGLGGTAIATVAGAFVTALGTQIYTVLAKKSANKFKTYQREREESRQVTGVMDSSELGNEQDGLQETPQDDLRETRKDSPNARRRWIVISVVLALVTVLIVAGVVSVVTAGEGLGIKAEEVISQVSTSTDDTDDASSSTTAATQSDMGSHSTETSQSGTASGASESSSNASTDTSDQSSGTVDSGADSQTSTGVTTDSSTTGTSQNTDASQGTADGSGSTTDSTQAGSADSAGTGTTTADGTAQ